MNAPVKTKVSKEIAVLRAISSAIVRERNVGRLLEEVIEILDREMGMLRGTIALLSGDELRIEASARMLNAEERALGRYRIGEGVTGSVARTGKAAVVPDVRKDRRFLNRTRSRRKDEALSFICVPLVHLGQVIGTLSVDRPITPASPDTLGADLALLEVVANITAEAAAVFREECAERETLLDENRRLRGMLGGAPGRLIGQCREMRAVYEQIRQVAPTGATVLVRGASGTGKELVARAIQSLSARKDKPFVVLNCAALPEALVESELFGHEKGAFTDARTLRVGRVEAADGGTLFLDEIGDLPVSTQVKLLRLLQDRTFSRVGSNAERRSDVRFIAATSRNLEDLMARKLFREDLYYRLSVFPIHLPDLARRQDDILLLARHFLAAMAAKHGKRVTRFSAPVVAILQSYPWPGNVRELENCVERAVLTASDDCIRSYNLPPALQNPDFGDDEFESARPATLDERLAAFERRVLEEALARHGGNHSAAGRELGVSPRMMSYRLSKAGLL
ncbi:MAG: sigma 54-interacting transcriptional regulator [Kiritimatiellae bacterium]|nr:sigma 54-interacting transcriptional regulator [Kiritimatiellia bacterium]